MSGHRQRRALLRERNTPGLWRQHVVQNHCKFHRWFNGLLVEPWTDLSGHVYWQPRSKRRPLIHKGGKP